MKSVFKNVIRPVIGKSSGQSWSAEAPTGLILTVISDTVIKLDWTNVDTTGDGVKVYISTDNATFILKATVALGVATYNASALTQSTKYYLKIVSYKGAVESGYSDYVYGVTWATAISDGNTVGWWDSQDLTTVTKDALNRVSQWNDKLGSGHNLVQTTDSKKPVWSKSGLDIKSLAGQSMKASGFTWNQPEYLYLVMRQNLFGNNKAFIAGNTDYNMLLRQVAAGAIPNIEAYAGTTSTAASNLNPTVLSIVRVLFNSPAGATTSKLQINEEAAITGNFGALNAGGLTIGSNAAQTSLWSDCEITEIIGRKTADSGATEASIYAYLKAKHQGVWVLQGVMLQETEAGDEHNVYEPTVLEDGGIFKMWYTGGWTTRNINYATSNDGKTWTKYVSNPVLSGYSRSSVIKVGSVFYMSALKAGELQMDTFNSNDGIAWTKIKDAAISIGAGGAWDNPSLGNNCLYYESGVFYNLYDGTGGGTGFKTGLATSNDCITWTKYASNPIINDVARCRAGNIVKKIGSAYYTWLIGSLDGSNLPSDIYRYRSSDLITWVADPIGAVFSRTQADEGVSTVVGQAADPYMTEIGGKCYLYYCGSADGSNIAGHQKIKLAIADMPLTELVKTKEGNIID